MTEPDSPIPRKRVSRPQPWEARAPHRCSSTLRDCPGAPPKVRSNLRLAPIHPRSPHSLQNIARWAEATGTEFRDSEEVDFRVLRFRPETYPLKDAPAVCYLPLRGQMSIGAMLLSEFDREMAKTRKILECVPGERFAWRPHEKSSTLATFWRKNECLNRSLSIRAVPHFCGSVRTDEPKHF